MKSRWVGRSRAVPLLQRVSFTLVVCAACTGDRPSPRQGDGDVEDAAGGRIRATDTADSAPVSVEPSNTGEAAHDGPLDTIDLANLPPAMPRPRAPVVLAGSCPGECCVYGDWLTSDITQVYARSHDTTEVAHTLTPRKPVTARAGFIRLDSLGSAVLTTDGVMYGPGGGQLPIPAGDTVLLLGYQGEGFYHAWYDGAVGELDVETQASVLHDIAADWWVEITSASGDGWLWMERTPLVWGADGCGMPGPPPAGVRPCTTEWFERVELAFPVSDGEGHGPDLGSAEWMGSISRRLGLENEDGLGPDLGSDDWCASIDEMLWGAGG